MQNTKHTVTRLALAVILVATSCLRSRAESTPDKAAKQPLVAVHDFTVGKQLQEWGIDGWTIAGMVEDQLFLQKHYRIVTRAKIAKVFKEQKLSATGKLDAGKFGKLLGVEYIVTGNLDLQGRKLILSAKMVDTIRDVGEIKKSFQDYVYIEGKQDLGRLLDLIDKFCHKLSMDNPALVKYGKQQLEAHNYPEAIDAIESAIKTTDDKSTLTELQTMLQIARSKQKAPPLADVLAQARSMLTQTAANVPDPQHADAIREINDNTTKILQFLLESKPQTLTPTQKEEIITLIKQATTQKADLWSGPTNGREWLLPDIWIPLRPISPGTFAMGGTEPDALPHKVTLTQPFWIGTHEVTINQFCYFLINAPYTNKADKYERDGEVKFNADYCPIRKNYRMKKAEGMTWGDKNQPMVAISWEGASLFCKWLTERERKAKRLPEGYEYRLPTEAEWEYCARAGTTTPYPFGKGASSLGSYAWYRDNSDNHTHVVGSKQPNGFGLKDMAGNVWEWCYDWYSPKYDIKNVQDPEGPDHTTDNLKVLRGGSFVSQANDLTSSTRYSFRYKDSKKNIGFRIVLAPEL